MTKLLGVLVVLAACADDVPDPHELVPCEGQSHNGVAITQCEAPCASLGIPAEIPCTLEDGEFVPYTFGWTPGRIRGVCVVELPHTRWVSCVD